MCTYVQLGALSDRHWRFHSLEASFLPNRSPASTHQKKCKHWSATLTFQVSGFFHSCILKAFSVENDDKFLMGSPTARNPTNLNKYNIKIV